MKGIHDVLIKLQPVALEDLTAAESVARAIGDDSSLALLDEIVARQHRHSIERSHVREDQTAVFPTGIPGLPDAILVGAVGRLARLIETSAFDIEQPAVIAAANAALFGSAVVERRSAVAAMLVEEPGTTLAIAKQNQILAEHSNALRQLAERGQSDGLPESPKELAASRAGTDLRHLCIVGRCRTPVSSHSELTESRSSLGLVLCAKFELQTSTRTKYQEPGTTSELHITQSQTWVSRALREGRPHS